MDESTGDIALADTGRSGDDDVVVLADPSRIRPGRSPCRRSVIGPVHPVQDESAQVFIVLADVVVACGPPRPTMYRTAQNGSDQVQPVATNQIHQSLEWAPRMCLRHRCVK